MEVKVIVRWCTRDEEAIALIRRRFNLPRYTTLNGLTPGTLRQEDREVFDECVRRGFFTYRKAEWRFNGKTYSW